MRTVARFGELRFSSWDEYRQAARDKTFARLKTLLAPQGRETELLRLLADMSGASVVRLKKVKSGTGDLRPGEGTQLRERLAAMRTANEERIGGPDEIVRELIDLVDVGRLLELPAGEKAQIELLLAPPPEPQAVSEPVSPIDWTVGAIVTVQLEGDRRKRGRKRKERPPVTILRGTAVDREVIVAPAGAIVTGIIGEDGSLTELKTEFQG